MAFSQYTHLKNDEIFKVFKVEPTIGLTPERALELKKEHGPNSFEGNEVAWWHILARQFISPFVYLLIFASLIAFFLGEFIDSFFIIFFVGLNAFLGFFQEYKSEETLKLLKKYVVSKAKVVRGGKEMLIESSDVVPGDIIIFEQGDIICSDTRLFDCYNFTVDESILTGESMQVKKIASELGKITHEIFEAHNIAFSGTTAVSGRAQGVVIGTRVNTSIGEISKLVSMSKRSSGFEKGVAQFSSFILRVIVITLVCLFFINIFIKKGNVNIAELIVFSIALAVSVIPEALPAVTTFSLSRGAMKLAKNKVVVKRLSAIEDLGGIEILCTDKTGTLTENNLTVDMVYSEEKERTLFLASLASSSFTVKKKEPNNAFDIALWAMLSEKERKEIFEYAREVEIPFDPVRRRNAILVKKNNFNIFIVRGAPEEIVKICHIEQSEEFRLNRLISDEGKRGRRIIAIAYKEIENVKADLSSEEKGMKFMGMISFVDPLKKTTKEAIEKAERLGIKIKILTGDSPEVAGAVAKEIKLIRTHSKVILGEAFEKMSLEKQHDAVEKYSVFARVSPQQKYKIIELLKEKNQVGFLGEGINDAPALKISDVGLAVFDASDIAREASDIILLNKSLNVIIDGIKEGREVFANTLKYIKATLASNFGNFYAVAIASLMIDFMPMLPIQILLVNLLSDFPMIAIATDTVDEEEIRYPQKYNIREIAFLATVLGLVSSIFDFIFFAIFFRISPQVLQTNWFVASIITELVFLFSIRSRRIFFKAKAPSISLIVLSVVACIVTLLIPFTSFGSRIFKFTPPSMQHIGWILGIVAIYFVVTELAKNFYYRFSSFAKS